MIPWCDNPLLHYTKECIMQRAAQAGYQAGERAREAGDWVTPILAAFGLVALITLLVVGVILGSKQ